MENKNLTKRERKELRRQEKQAQKTQTVKSKTFKSLLTWGLVVLGIALAIWEMHNMIFDNQNTWSEDNNAASIFRGYAQNLSLDLTKYDTAVSSQEVKSKVDNHYTSGVQSNVTYTPTFYLNGQKIANPSNLGEFRTLIQAA